MEEGRDQRVRFPCSYCKRNVSEFGCRCDESGRISRRQLQTLREKFFSEGSFSQEYESEHDHNGQFLTGIEDYAEDDADFERIVNMLADENQNVARRFPAEKSAVQKLVTVEIKDDCDTGMCCIYQERMIEGDLAKKIACGHLYQGRCIIKWLTYSNFCPICKYALPSA
ncbi:hypothetical protein SUGI_0728810 [Cryptomeria japonica]|nr:hypothetical protein SUGI_0728810 [Cryptomeria japonica]